MDEVEALGLTLVMKVQEIEVQVEVWVQVQVHQKIQAWISEPIECFEEEQHQGMKIEL